MRLNAWIVSGFALLLVASNGAVMLRLAVDLTDDPFRETRAATFALWTTLLGLALVATGLFVARSEGGSEKPALEGGGREA